MAQQQQNIPANAETTPKTPIRGIDVSHHNGPIDWHKVAADDIQFAFLKASEGVQMTDSTFATHYKGAREAGVLVGAYHFYRTYADPVAQADRLLGMLEKVGGLKVDDLPPVLDIEDADGASRSAVVKGAHAFLDRIVAKTGRKPLVYTSPGFAEASLDSSFGDYPLWVAHYKTAKPRVPAGWQNWLIWQQVSGEGGQGWKIDGIKYTDQLPGVDGNIYRGTREQLVAALCPRPSTLVFLSGKQVTTAWLNPADGTNYGPIRQLLEGLFTPGQVNTLLSFDASRRPVWNGKRLDAPHLCRSTSGTPGVTGVGGSSQLWVQVRGFADWAGLIVTHDDAAKTITLSRPVPGGQG